MWEGKNGILGSAVKKEGKRRERKKEEKNGDADPVPEELAQIRNVLVKSRSLQKSEEGVGNWEL